MDDRILNSLDNQLGNAVAPGEHHWLSGVQIDEADSDLTAVSGIHCSRCIDNGHPGLGGQP